MSWSTSSNSSANALALLSQNRLQAVLGGLSAGYFNALEKGLPIIIGLSRVSTPIAHNLMLRADLKDQVKEIRGAQGQDHRHQWARLRLHLRDRKNPRRPPASRSRTSTSR